MHDDLSLPGNREDWFGAGAGVGVGVDSLVTHATDHVGDEVGTVPAVLEHGLTEDLTAHLQHGLLAEEGERLRDSVGRDTVALKADLLHRRDLGRGLEGQMLRGIPLSGHRLPRLLDQEVGDRRLGSRRLLAHRPNDRGGLRGLLGHTSGGGRSSGASGCGVSRFGGKDDGGCRVDREVNSEARHFAVRLR